MLEVEAVPQSCSLQVQSGLSIVLYVSLLLAESFDLCLSSQHVLVRAIPSFYFMKTVLWKVSLLGELHIVYMDQETCFFSCTECDVDESISFHSSLSKSLLDGK
jgi:hypothetical protein